MGYDGNQYRVRVHRPFGYRGSYIDIQKIILVGATTKKHYSAVQGHKKALILSGFFAWLLEYNPWNSQNLYFHRFKRTTEESSTLCKLGNIKAKGSADASWEGAACRQKGLRRDCC